MSRGLMQHDFSGTTHVMHPSFKLPPQTWAMWLTSCGSPLPTVTACLQEVVGGATCDVGLTTSWRRVKLQAGTHRQHRLLTPSSWFYSISICQTDSKLRFMFYQLWSCPTYIRLCKIQNLLTKLIS